jgi:hypothetical protein
MIKARVRLRVYFFQTVLALVFTNVYQNVFKLFSMEHHSLKIVNNCLNAKIYSYLETSGGQSSNPYVNVVHFFNTRVD